MPFFALFCLASFLPLETVVSQTPNTGKICCEPYLWIPTDGTAMNEYEVEVWCRCHKDWCKNNCQERCSTLMRDDKPAGCKYIEDVDRDMEVPVASATPPPRNISLEHVRVSARKVNDIVAHIFNARLEGEG